MAASCTVHGLSPLPRPRPVLPLSPPSPGSDHSSGSSRSSEAAAVVLAKAPAGKPAVTTTVTEEQAEVLRLEDHGYTVDWTHDTLGVGAHGRVHRGRRLRDGLAVALKLVAPSADAWEEVELHRACLPHPHVADLLDAFEALVPRGPDAGAREERRLVVVCELCTGGDLFGFIKTQHPRGLPEGQARELLRQLSAALAHVHACGVVHHDVKAENVLLTRRKAGSPWQAKLCDFGLAKRLQDHTGPRGLSAGYTAAYVAPEVLLRARLEQGAAPELATRCDVWSLGVLFYAMLCGYPPFFSVHPTQPGVVNADMAKQIRKARFDFAWEDWHGVSTEARALVRAMLVPAPAKRLSSADLQTRLFHNTSIHRAAECGALHAVESHLRSGTANAPSPNGTTPLAAAVNANALAVVRLLLGAGAAAVLDRPNNQGWTPVAMAAYRDNVEVLRELLAAGADPKRPVVFADGHLREPASLAPPASPCVALLHGPARLSPSAARRSIRALPAVSPGPTHDHPESHDPQPSQPQTSAAASPARIVVV